MSAFPAIAALMCCERHEQLVTTIDGFIDVLHKQLRERRIATMAILCLCRVVGCFIRRMSPRSDAGGLKFYISVSSSRRTCNCTALFMVALERECQQSSPPTRMLPAIRPPAFFAMLCPILLGCLQAAWPSGCPAAWPRSSRPW